MTSPADDRTWIVIPTYNERHNLEPLLTDITERGTWRILVVDDASPDGTGDLAESLRTRWPRLEVLHRRGKEGLGAAYRQALRHVLERGAERIVHLDSDRSHPPELIPGLLAALDDHDLAIASRYVRGGSMKIDLWRQLVSWIGNTYIRAMLGRRIMDWSTGYKAWRASLLARILPAGTSAAGYAWLMEMNWLALRTGARVCELPLVFRERQADRSKFNWHIVIEDIRVAWQLRRRERLAKEG